MEEKFTSRLSFVMASVGSAVGLGNLFRFPALAVKYGGIFIPVYISLLALLGLPLLTCELAAGRYYQKSAVGCMGAISKKARPLGWAASANSFIIMSYYCLLFSFVLLAALFSFRLNAANADSLFLDYISPKGGFPFDTQLLLAAAWGAVILCYGRAENLGKISTVSVLFSVGVILVIALIRGISCPRALAVFLRPDPAPLLQPSFWADALGQVFFSLSVGVGVMFAYGSFLRDGESIPLCGGIIAAIDLLVSLAATLIYASVGPTGDDGLLLTCFSVYPKAFIDIFGSLGRWVCGLFYLSLALLCLASVFSYLKSAASAAGPPKTESKRAVILALAAAGIGLIMLMDEGLRLLHLTDSLAARYLTLTVGLFEFIIFGYLAPPELISSARGGRGRGNLFYFLLKIFCPAALIFLILSS